MREQTYRQSPTITGSIGRLDQIVARAVDLKLKNGSSLHYCSNEMAACIAQAIKLATSPQHILIIAETGAGKELFARFIHEQSKRAGALIIYDCTSISDSIADEEFRGHLKGTFTGATADRKGIFEAAKGGTVYLDEFGELQPSLQVKLLRILQERAICRIGGREEIKSDFRVVAATNRDVFQMVESGEFRRDLLARFPSIIRIPPLRERRNDIPLLIACFLQSAARENGLEDPPAVCPEAQAFLTGYHYPENVRELYGIISTAVALTKPEPVITYETLSKIIEARQPGKPVSGYSLSISAIHTSNRVKALKGKDAEFMRLVEEYDTLSQAADALGVSRQAVWKRRVRIKRNYGI